MNRKIITSPNRCEGAAGTRDDHQLAACMRRVEPIRDYQSIAEVVELLDEGGRSGTPVVDERFRCVGILTRTDIGHYLQMLRRFERRDETVIDEMFETDEFGQRRALNRGFHQVRRHMTSPAVVVPADATRSEACRLFSRHPHIHHLVVVDDDRRPRGILERRDVQCDHGNLPRGEAGP